MSDWRHQSEFLEQHTHDEYHGLFWEQGTGKTRALSRNAEELFKAGKIDAVLIVALPGGERNWIDDQLPEHLDPAIKAQSKMMYWQTIKAGTQWHQRAFSQLLAHPGLIWLALTYPAWPTKPARLALHKLLTKRRVLFICDEAMSEGGIKSPSGKRSKSIVAAGKLAPYRRLADGTPVAEGPFDFYAPTKFLQHDYWKRHLGEETDFAIFKKHFGIWRTRAEVLEEKGYDPKYDLRLGYKNLDELNEHLRRVGSRVTKDDCLDLPPKVYNPLARFELTPEQRRMYDQMREDFIASWSGGSTEAGIVLTQVLRLQQITCGYLPNDDADGDLEMFIKPADNPRLKLMEEIRDRTHEKTIVWTRNRPDVDLLMDLLGPGAVRYDGGVDQDECERSKHAFQKGDAKWFVSTYQKGSTTITLHAAHHVVNYCNSIKLRHRLQSEDRAHRGGLDHSVDYTDIVATGTVDEKTVQALRKKKDVSDTITGDEPGAWI